MDAEFLSRIQFAITAGFHFLFPPISIGLGLYLVLVEAAWLRSGDEKFRRAAKFFTKLFAVIFAVGVATGIILEFEFGTNWPIYSNFVGDVFGSPLAIEAVFAFFLESVFLGLSVWGWDRLGKRAHFFSTCMLCLGAHLSAVWIIAANSFMQTPAGFELQFTDPITGAVQTLAQGAVPTAEQIPHTRAVISDFWKMALSASFADRFFHTVAGAWICGAFFALGVCGWLVLKGRTNFAEPCAKIALVFGAVSAAAMMFTGHESARTLAHTQPEKIAAFEGHYNTVSSAPLCLVGNVDEQKREVSGIKADGLFSFLAFGSFDSEVKGLNDLPSDEFLRRIYPNATPAELERVRPKFWPPVNFSFHSFRIMAYLGGAIAAFAAWGFALWIFGILFDLRKPLSKWFWRASLFSILLPLAASQAGWALAEVGRQPWIVWHVLKTSDAVTTSASAGEILFSIILFSSIFAAVTAVALKILFSKIGAEG